MPGLRTAFVHYTAPPVVGGVKAVLEAHAQIFLDAGYPVKIITGRRVARELPEDVEFELMRKMDTLPSLRSKVYSGYPWNLLSTAYPGIKYVTISEQRQQELALLLHIPQHEIAVVYNGIDPKVWYGLSTEGLRLVQRMRGGYALAAFPTAGAPDVHLGYHL